MFCRNVFVSYSCRRRCLMGFNFCISSDSMQIEHANSRRFLQPRGCQCCVFGLETNRSCFTAALRVNNRSAHHARLYLEVNSSKEHNRITFFRGFILCRVPCIKAETNGVLLILLCTLLCRGVCLVPKKVMKLQISATSAMLFFFFHISIAE